MNAIVRRVSPFVVALAMAASLIGGPSPAHAQNRAADEISAADLDPETEHRLKRLSEELRCLVCQNQTVADSNAALAQDLRNLVLEQMRKGKTDQEIKDFLVERYGDFVLYRPPVKSSTALLWVGPFALLAIGAVAWLVVQRRSRQGRAANPLAPPPPDDAARERARKLLD